MGRTSTYNSPTPAVARARRAFEARLERERRAAAELPDVHE